MKCRFNRGKLLSTVLEPAACDGGQLLPVHLQPQQLQKVFILYVHTLCDWKSLLITLERSIHKTFMFKTHTNFSSNPVWRVGTILDYCMNSYAVDNGLPMTIIYLFILKWFHLWVLCVLIGQGSEEKKHEKHMKMKIIKAPYK